MSALSRQFVTAIVVGAGLAAWPAAASSQDPIEGTWFYGGGQVLVEPTGPGTFKGTVVAPTTFSACTHPAGERMWEILKTGTTYSGTHNYFNLPACSPAGPGRAIWEPREESGRFILRFCSSEPGSSEPVPSDCDTLQRAKAPDPKTTCTVAPGQRICLDSPQELKTFGCLRPGAFTHRFGVRLKKRSGGSVVNRRSRVRIVKFTLDGRASGSDRRRPYYANVKGASLVPGAHVLRANVTLRVPRTNKQFRRKLSLRFNVCG